jgi:SP family myo-inositol transporter-like MFS transporter 13
MLVFIADFSCFHTPQMVFFLFFYALGLGIVPWLVQSEIFSGDVRGVGGGLATATNWTCNLFISATYLDLVRGG